MKYTAVGTNTAKKYAQAFFNTYLSHITPTNISSFLKAQKFLQTHKRTLFFLQLPQFDEAMRLSMAEDLVSFFSLPEACVHIFLLLIRHNRSFLIPDVLLFIITLYKEREGIIDFAVTSAHVLSDQQKSVIADFLSFNSHKKSLCTYAIDKKLIAGIRAQSVGYVWEYSVRKQLSYLRALEK